jgi:hypothetical protein
MMNEFEYEGIWWLPENPEKKLQGKLKFTPWDGALLDLIGSFKENQNIFAELEPDIILGITVTGKNVTLHKCLEFRSSTNYPGFPTSSFYANIVFVGVHFERSVDIRFKALSIQYLHLDEWVNISGFKMTHEPEAHRTIIEYKLPEPIQAKISDDFGVWINFEATLPLRSRVQKEASITQKIEIKIEATKENSFEYFTRIAYHISNFLSLICSEPTHILAIKGKTGANKTMIKDTPYYPSVEIFYAQFYIPKAIKTLLPHDMLFTFKDIQDKLKTLLQNWFAKLDELEPTYSLYFSTLYDPSMLQEHRFLNLIHCIESLHRSIYGEKYLSDENYMKEVYSPLVNAIPPGVKGDLKKSLESGLKYGNEFSLRTRLKAIYKKHQELLNKFIKNKKTFIEQVYVTRNYLIHHDKDLKERAASGVALYHLSNKLKKLVEICLLTELGFSSAEIQAAFSRNRKYRQEIIR